MASVFVSLEKNSEDFVKVKLELFFVLVLFLQDLDVLIVELVIFVVLLALLFVFVVLNNSLAGLVDELEDLSGELVNTVWLQKVLAGFFNNFFDCLGLFNEAVGLGFGLHGFNDVV